MSFFFNPLASLRRAQRSAHQQAVIDALTPEEGIPQVIEKGTSYTATGSKTQPSALTFEIGSAVGQQYPDPVPELSALPNAQIVYRKMVRGDASVRISLRASKIPVLGADYYIEPYDSSEECKLHAEFAEYNLFSAMRTPWLKFLEHLTTCYENGFSNFEPLWSNREWAPSTPGANRRVYTMLDELAFRPAETVSEWVFDTNGHLEGIWQNAYDATGGHAEVFIPTEKLLTFTFEQSGNDPRGMSVLRSAYPHWWYKNYLYKVDGIQKERNAIGIPDIELQPGATPEDKVVAHELGRNMRANQNSYVVRNPMIKVGFIELQGQPIDVLRSAIHHDDMIMKNVLIQYLQQGVGESGGGRATSATSQDMFMKASRYLATSFADTMNENLIPPLITYNFDTDKFPKIRVRNIGEVKDLQTLATAYSNLLAQNALQMDDDLEQFFRDVFQLPRRTTPWVPVEERTQRVTEIETKSLDAAPTGGNAGGNGNGGGGSDKGGIKTGIKSGNVLKGTAPH